MSPPGVDVTGTGRKLLDPRFSNLQLHQRGSGNMPLQDAGNSNNPRVWRLTVTFPVLPSEPLVFVNTKFPGQNFVDYPASMVPQSDVYLPGLGYTAKYYNWFTVTTDTLIITVYTNPDSTSIPTYRYEIYKNTR